MFHFHKWIALPISLGLIKRGVIDRRACSVCSRTFIKKAFYKNFFGRLVWMETRKYNDKDTMKV